jgi:hypothetical protein
MEVSMFRTFSGPWRGSGSKQAGEAGHPYLQLAFEFRHSLHFFKGATLSVFLCLALHADEQGRSFPAYKQIRDETGLSNDTIGRALDQLCGLEIEGQRVLLRYRLRDQRRCFVGSNRYILFPTARQLAQHATQGQSRILPEVENAEIQKSVLNKNHLINQKKSMRYPQNRNLGADAPARAFAHSPQPLAERIQSFPEDCRAGAGLMHAIFGLKPPEQLPGQKGDFALWIRGLRRLNSLAADYQVPIEQALRLTRQQWERDPFNLAHPAALVRAMTGALAGFSLNRASAAPEETESPLAIALKNFIPRMPRHE